MQKYLIQFVIAAGALAQAGLVHDVAAAPGVAKDEVFKLTAADRAPFRVFGTSVAVSGQLALVGAPGAGNRGLSSGSAYLFDVTTGQQLANFTSSEAAPQHQFGSSVALSGHRAIVGAYGDTTAGAGAAYVFDVATGQELFKIVVDDAHIGNAVAISGDVAIVGSYSDTAYLFNVATGQRLFKLTASDTIPNDYFGFSVGISGNTAIVGSLNNGAYLFDVTTGEELQKLTDENPAAYAFGQSVAISGNTAIVGSPNIGSAAATLFDVATGLPLAKLTAPESPDLFGTSVAIDGSTAIVGGWSYQESVRFAFLFDAITGRRRAKLTPADDMALHFQEVNFGEAVAISGDFAVVGFSQDKAFTGSAYVYSTVPEPTSLFLACLGATLLYERRSPLRRRDRRVRAIPSK
jgi:outer membrane protein assembly factor BamB